MDLKEQIDLDLSKKLYDDYKKACLHYSTLARIAEIDPGEQVSSMICTTQTFLLRMLLTARVPKKVVLDAMSQGYDSMFQALQEEEANDHS